MARQIAPAAEALKHVYKSVAGGRRVTTACDHVLIVRNRLFNSVQTVVEQLRYIGLERDLLRLSDPFDLAPAQSVELVPPLFVAKQVAQGSIESIVRSLRKLKVEGFLHARNQVRLDFGGESSRMHKGIAPHVSIESVALGLQEQPFVVHQRFVEVFVTLESLSHPQMPGGRLRIE
ncbi:MAG: hypothetical protein AAFX94_04835 [Myxococcota bacterium]